MKSILKISILSFLLLMAFTPLIALGRADNSEPQEVNGLENWEADLDVSELAPGEYNILVTGKDRAGNIGTGGPYNVFIDPSIQIPVVSISTPAEGSRVGNLINVVGTAMDDKAVERVEIAVDDGNFQPAEGGAFWSASFDSSSWDDGLHKIRVRAWDADRNESPEAVVFFYKDTVKPEITITSHEPGSYLSGKIYLEGMIFDHNGVESAYFDNDYGIPKEVLYLKKGEEEGQFVFSFYIDTRDVEDGSHVFSIEAEDGLGSISKQLFLYYIDNSAPELSLISPKEEDIVNGKITLVGKAEDRVGISSLMYEADNGTAGEIMLSPGNPVWVLPLDYSGVKSNKAWVKLVLTDIVGNITTETFSIVLSRDQDIPKTGAVVFETEYRDYPVVRGLLNDDDGHMGSIEYSLNGTEWSSVEVSGPWSIMLKDAFPGQNSLKLRAIDQNGTIGEVEEFNINRTLPEPHIVIDGYGLNEDVVQWFSGTVVNMENRGVLIGRFKGPESVSKLYWRLNGEDSGKVYLENPDDEGWRIFQIHLPKNSIEGRNEISVYYDELSCETVYYAYQPPKVEEGEPVPEYVVPDSVKIHLTIPNISSGGFTILGPEFISGWVPGADIKSIEISEGSDFLKTEISGSSFKLSAKNEGYTDSLVIKVKLDNGKELVSKSLKVSSDSKAPSLKLSGLEPGMTVGDRLIVSGELDDNSGQAELFYSIDGGNVFKKLFDLSGSDKINFEEEITISGGNENLVDLVLMAKDIFGNEETRYIPLFHDTAVPEIELITSSFEPGTEQITISGRVSDNSGIEGVKISFPPPVGEDSDSELPSVAKEFEAGIYGDVFYLDVNLTSLGFEPFESCIEAFDKAENRAELNLPMNVDLAKGKPIVGIQVPAEGDSFETGFSLSGLILDKEGIDSIEYSINNGPYVSIEGSNIFTLPITLGQLSDNENSISLRARDINGLQSDLVSREFLISHEPPEVELNYPTLDSIIQGSVLLKGRASDVNGIRSVFISRDNGKTFQKADGTDEWSYLLDTSLMPDGISSLLIMAEDNAGVKGFNTSLIKIDNQAPEISLSHPVDGEQIRTPMPLCGRVFDNTGIESLSLYVSPIEICSENTNGESSEELLYELDSEGAIIESIDLGGLSAGTYSITIKASDEAKNVNAVSRVIRLLPEKMRAPVILSPLPGESLGPMFSIQGYLPDYAPKAFLMVNGTTFKVIDVEDDGSFHFAVTPEDSFPVGEIKLSAGIESGEDKLLSPEISVNYSDSGLWLRLDNLVQNQYVSDRFVIEGSAGFIPENPNQQEAGIEGPDRMVLSFDGGRTFENLRIRNGKWSYTIYGEEFPDGEVFLLAGILGEENPVWVRCRFVMDTIGPEIKLLSLNENEKIFDKISMSGNASDNGGITELSVSFREGDKDEYETPSFIQGMYLDASALGPTYFTAGMGLSFMDDNVKLQFHYGYAPTTTTDQQTEQVRLSRFGGHVVGAKLLANIAQLPFSWLFGPGFSLFSATASLGANFSYFSNNLSGTQGDWGVILAGVVGQIELPKITFRDRRFLKYISLYWEGQLWLVSSDVSPEVILLPNIGIRLGLF